jgi:hypothetical protein
MSAERQWRFHIVGGKKRFRGRNDPPEGPYRYKGLPWWFTYLPEEIVQKNHRMRACLFEESIGFVTVDCLRSNDPVFNRVQIVPKHW